MSKNYSKNQIDTAAFVYARSDSSRLPGKVFLPLGKKTMIEVILKRAKESSVNKVVLLTTERSIDDEIVSIAKNLKFEIIRGDEKDLVSRTLKAIDKINPKKFVRVNADSPFFEPKFVKKIIQKNLNYDFITNLINRRFPYGVAIEIVDTKFYKLMARIAMSQEKEHVTKHIYRQLKRSWKYLFSV